MPVTPIELTEWANSLATQELVERMKEAKQETMERWANQCFETEMAGAFALGGIATINEVLEYIEESKNA